MLIIPPLQSKNGPSFLHDRQTLNHSRESWRFCELDVFQKTAICTIKKKKKKFCNKMKEPVKPQQVAVCWQELSSYGLTASGQRNQWSLKSSGLVFSRPRATGSVHLHQEDLLDWSASTSSSGSPFNSHRILRSFCRNAASQTRWSLTVANRLSFNSSLLRGQGHFR